MKLGNAWKRVTTLLIFLTQLHAAGCAGTCSSQEPAATSSNKETRAESDGDSAKPARNPLEKVAIELDKDFGEGWKQTVRAKPGDDACDVYDLWVEDGWLYVRRTDENGELDWQIKLAKALRVGVPSISMVGQGIAFHVSSEDGRYFLRETMFLLRAVRQRSGSEGSVPRKDLIPEDFERSGYGSSHSLTLSGWQNETWFYAASGPDQEHFNCLVRLNPLDMQAPGNGFQSVAGDFASMFHGDTRVWDDGELLLASRTLRASYEAELVRRRIRNNLPGSFPPEIEAAQWLNTEPLTWKDLKGKVILLDFWGTWCGPCVKNLPDVQQRADEYADQGLVVIGIHSAMNADTCAAYVKKAKLTFPIAVDTGATEERYAIEGVPAYFLIDKTGQVVDGYSARLPDEAVIQNLLTAEVRQNRDNDEQ